MCDVCEMARTQPVEVALNLIAREMAKYPGLTCLDDLVGELAGESIEYESDQDESLEDT